jgi:RNA polymerase sigma-70 factor, ECF subfamily
MAIRYKVAATPSSAPHDAAGAERERLDRALPAVYDELRRIAHSHLRGERPGHTLNTTSLVHEAYLRISRVGGIDWMNRSHFLGMASRAMRRVLVDYARARGRRKRADPGTELHVEAPVVLPIASIEDLMSMDDALTRLEALQPRACRVVECRFFAGMTHDETAESLGISVATVKRDWTLARAWLNAELRLLGVAADDAER